MRYMHLPHALCKSSILLLFLALPHCTHRCEFLKKELKIVLPPVKSNSEKDSALAEVADVHKPADTITIWIHGTRFFRQQPFNNYFGGKPSLRLFGELDKDCNLRKIGERLLVNTSPELCPETFYIFGWSGKLDAVEREQAADILYQELLLVAQDFKKRRGFDPSITILTHSHGGNVALNLAKIVPNNAQDSLTIDRLILLACPVQAGTMDLVQNPFFKKTYALYSSLDIVQVLAPQITYSVADSVYEKPRTRIKFPPFSQRYFPHSDNMAQVKLRLNGRAIMHQEFISAQFLRLLPTVITAIDQWHNQTAYDKHRRLLSVRTTKSRNANTSLAKDNRKYGNQLPKTV